MSLPISIMLAEDDEDDCLFFKDASLGLKIPTHLTTVNDGEKFMQLLSKMKMLLLMFYFWTSTCHRKMALIALLK